MRTLTDWQTIDKARQLKVVRRSKIVQFKKTEPVTTYEIKIQWVLRAGSLD